MAKPVGSPGKGGGNDGGKGGGNDGGKGGGKVKGGGGDGGGDGGVTIQATGVIEGTNGDDVLIGSDVDDVLIGLDGNDFMDGSGGSDTYLVFGYDGVDTIMDSGLGVEGVQLASSDTSAVEWDVLLAGEKGTVFYMSEFSAVNGIEEISSGGFGGVDIRGTAGNNVLDFSGTLLTGIALINGLGGDDTITGSWGDDRILGGGGNDTLYGGEGDDLLVGNSGADLLEGGAGSDTFVLGNVHDAGDTIVDFTPGEDVIQMSGIVYSADYVDYSLVQNDADTIIRVELDDGSTNDVATLLNVIAEDLSGWEFLV